LTYKNVEAVRSETPVLQLHATTSLQLPERFAALEDTQFNVNLGFLSAIPWVAAQLAGAVGSYSR
jgi:hypothetical protein